MIFHSEHSLIKSLLVGSVILVFHVFLLGTIGIMVIFFGGLANYLLWILLGGLAMICGLIYLGIHYMRKQGGAALSRILSLPEFRNRDVEVNFLGGLASLKVGNDRSVWPVAGALAPEGRREDPKPLRLQELTALTRLREKDLISGEEYDRAKKALFN